MDTPLYCILAMGSCWSRSRRPQDCQDKEEPEFSLSVRLRGRRSTSRSPEPPVLAVTNLVLHQQNSSPPSAILQWSPLTTPPAGVEYYHIKITPMASDEPLQEIRVEGSETQVQVDAGNILQPMQKYRFAVLAVGSGNLTGEWITISASIDWLCRFPGCQRNRLKLVDGIYGFCSRDHKVEFDKDHCLYTECSKVAVYQPATREEAESQLVRERSHFCSHDHYNSVLTGERDSLLGFFVKVEGSSQEYRYVENLFQKQWNSKIHKPELSLVLAIVNPSLEKKFTEYKQMHIEAERKETKLIKSLFYGAELGCDLHTYQASCKQSTCSACDLALHGFGGHLSQGGVTLDKNPARSHEKAKVHEEYLIHGLLLFDVACANTKKMLRASSESKVCMKEPGIDVVKLLCRRASERGDMSCRLERQDVKLDRFLRQELCREEYERVCKSEACVIRASGGEKWVHRYAVLGHKCLYSTEIPPKHIETLVKLEDITAISVLDDLPDFLSGDEKQNTVHIQICCKQSVCAKDRKRKTYFLQKKSPKERSDYNGRRSNSPLSSPGQSSPHLGTVQSSPVLEVVKSSPILGRRSPQLHPHVGTGTHRSPPGQEYMALSDLAITHHHNTTRSSGLPGRSPGLPRKSKVLDYDEESPLITERSSSLQEITIPTVKVRKRKVEYSPSTKLGSDSSSEETWVKSASMRHLASDSHLSVTGFLSSEDRTVSQPDLYSNGSPTSTRRIGHLNRAASSESVHMASVNGSNTLLHRELDGSNSGVEMAVIDIFILKQVTDFSYYLKATWNNAKINQLLEDNFDSPSLPTKSSPKPYDQFYRQFCSLKEELLTARRLEDSAQLAQELCTAALKYFIIKKIFWEDSELLEYFTKQLHLYIGSETSTSKTVQLEDRIEYSIIILEVLYQMLKETQSIQKKLVQLTCNNGQALMSLAVSTSSGFPHLHKVSHTQRLEFTEKSCGVMYELFAVSEQACWPLIERTKVSTTWLVESLARNIEMRDFVSGALAYVARAMCTDLGHQVVGLYHISVLFHTFVTTCAQQLRFFRTHFTEEFKYYINISKGRQMLPTQHALTRNALELLTSCKTKVLGGQ